MNQLAKWINKVFRKFDPARHTPHEISLGFCIGTFLNISLGIIPGLSLVLAIPLMFILPKLNRLAILVALAFWNFFTLIPVYIMSYYLGRFLFGSLPHINYESFSELASLSSQTLWQWFLANGLVALVVSLFAYLPVRKMASWYLKKRDS